MEPFVPWLVTAGAAVLGPGLMLGLRLISPGRFARIVAGLLTGLLLGFVAARLAPGGPHG
ncbi:MAG: hypothetical protein QME55_12295 [Brevundimonas sp.]|uniref:hypothetical protein n=1 Tax=Brevundimonas sp. TaxID=1871086 RepID=UPI0026378405|nr:hypothetical protein [Brevundimonas sp.]MDI6625503.1 hypothetical protein [Brevundimonas sp.]MDQ7813600.1 hypothetical protein [Brevundimonas sp.]